jgi:hypothetical protein
MPEPRYAFNPEEGESGVTRVTLADVATWRVAESAAGRPCALLDYFKAHRICMRCKGNRRAVVAFRGIWPIMDICPQCGGTGRPEDPPGRGCAPTDPQVSKNPIMLIPGVFGRSHGSQRRGRLTGREPGEGFDRLNRG